MLEELGTVDLIQSVTQKEFPSARVEKRRLQAMETYQDLSKQIQEKSSNVDELAQVIMCKYHSFLTNTILK